RQRLVGVAGRLGGLVEDSKQGRVIAHFLDRRVAATDLCDRTAEILGEIFCPAFTKRRTALAAEAVDGSSLGLVGAEELPGQLGRRLICDDPAIEQTVGVSPRLYFVVDRHRLRAE